jgi:hypothetical protein
LGKSELVIYSLGANLYWASFDFGAIRSRIKASEARAQDSLDSYELTVATPVSTYWALGGDWAAQRLRYRAVQADSQSAAQVDWLPTGKHSSRFFCPGSQTAESISRHHSVYLVKRRWIRSNGRLR